ncbi:MAG: energy-coupling factor ABC transporter ATP-binding protein [Thermoprotei archaeon]
MSIISFDGVYYTYPLSEKPALNGMTLEISKGERVALLGGNGAGKTTALKHVNGLLRPNKGSVKIYGEDTRKTNTSNLSRKVGIVFQNPNHQLFAQTCWDEVAFALKNFGYDDLEIEKRVESTLRFFGLWDYKDESPFLLSVGEKKRLTIASVLIYEPQILVLDEPTAGQDIEQKKKIGNLLSSFKGEAVIASTHDMDFAARNFSRVVIMSSGKIVADGPTRDIFYMGDWKSAGILEPQTVSIAKITGISSHPLTSEEFVEAFKEEVAK